MTVEKEGGLYIAILAIQNVAVEDAGKYKVTAKNELGESNATISLNFDSKFFPYKKSNILSFYYKRLFFRLHNIYFQQREKAQNTIGFLLSNF